jgi:hypothetical protein
MTRIFRDLKGFFDLKGLEEVVGEDVINGNRLIVNELPLLASSPTTS